MRFRKEKFENGYRLEAFKGDVWQAVEPHSDLYQQFLTASGQTVIDTHDPKPFAPKSYRDFMLFEAHYINAAKNYVKSHKPLAYTFARMYERLSGKVPTKLKPAPLWYKQPIFYMGGHLNFYAHGQKIIWPDYSQIMDYELEIGCVLTKPLINASPREAREAIGGFVVFNDFSARDIQMPEMQSGFGPQKSKHFANAISSEFVTADEILPRLDALKGTVCINGKTVAHVSSKGMQFSLDEAIAHVSKSEHLYPGEFFATGTLPNGCGLENGHFLAPGDRISLKIEGIGALENTIAHHEKKGRA